MNKNDKKIVRLKVYLALAVIFALTLIFMPKSISGMPEIENKLLVTVLALDKENDKIKVSGTAIMPGENQTPSIEKTTVSALGRTVGEALDGISVKMGRPVELGLCGAVIIGSGFENESVIEPLNYLIASGKIIPGAYLLHANKSTGAEIIEKNNNLSKASASGINKVIEYNAVANNVPTTTILRFLTQNAGKSKSAYLPCIEFENKQQEGKNDSQSGKSEPSGSSSSGNSSQTQGEKSNEEINTLNSVALYKEGVKVAVMDKETTRGLVWTDTRSTLGLVVLDKLIVNCEKYYSIPCQLLNKKFRINCAFVNGKPQALFSLSITLGYDSTDIINTIYKKYRLSGKEMEDRIREGFARQIKNELEMVVKKMRENDCDAVLVADHFYKFCFREFSDYSPKERIFDDCKIDYEVKIRFA